MLLLLVALTVALLAIAAQRRSRPRFSERYRQAVAPWNKSWQATRKLTMSLSWGRDCVMPLLPAQQVDHLHYRNLGAEIPWIDVVPLHTRTHEIVTVLSRSGLRMPVNLILRLMYGTWILADAYAIAWLLALLHVIAPIPPPMVLLEHIQAMTHMIERLVHLP